MSINLRVFIEIKGKRILVGRLEGETSSNTSFIYDAHYLNKPSSKPISISLPLQPEPFSNERTRNFFDGLLPEGYTRRCIVSEMRVDSDDYISILKNLGKECLGAIQILDEYETDINAAYEEMSQKQLQMFAQEGAMESAALVTKSHLSLTGASGKAGLYYDNAEDKWYIPLGSAPSTHIVKQSHIRLDQIVTNEQLCLLTAKKLGIDVPESFIIRFNDISDSNVLFATKRYDRKPGQNRYNKLLVPYRLHQEDFAQALGIPAEQKYERVGEQYLMRMMKILQEHSGNPALDQMKLWRIVVFNYLVGNTDNHIKNSSIIYSESLARIELAPAYDIISTLVYDSSTEDMALLINGKKNIFDITRDDFMQEVKSFSGGTSIFMKEYDRLSKDFKNALGEAALELSDAGFSNSQDLSAEILRRRFAYTESR